MPPIPDLVRDSRLETTFLDQKTTVHTFIEPDGASGRSVRREYWKKEVILGRGGFGDVRREQCIAGKDKGTLRAVKVIRKQSSLVDLYRELEAISKFSHSRVCYTCFKLLKRLTLVPQYNSWFVKSFGWFDNEESIFIAMEYCPNGDLHHYLSDKQKLPPAEAQQLTYQILDGLHQMHENGFAHRDLKPGASVLSVIWHSNVARMFLSNQNRPRTGG
jgi:serine/threonine protein kinase